jgi:hypothetical protein
MTITRRMLLKSAVFAAAAATETGWVVAAVSASSPIELRIFDSQAPASRDWLGPHVDWAVDVSIERSNRWTQLRAVKPRGRVLGLTTWSDFVQVRGLFEEKGKRLQHESRSGRLFYWEMV